MDVILATQTPAALAAKQATSVIPIVMTAADLVGSGLVDSLARPGRNITGLTFVYPELDGKRLQLLREVAPNVSRIAILLMTAGNPAALLRSRESRLAAEKLGVSLQAVEVGSPFDFASAFAAIRRERAGALLVTAFLTTNQKDRKAIVELAAKHRLPTLYDGKEAVGRQGLQWQVGVWDRISQLYLREVDRRFATVVENVVRRGDLKPGYRVLDLGTGTGSVAIGAAGLVGPAGKVTGVDISPDMLALARRRVVESGHTNIDLREGGAEQLPTGDGSIDVLLASLSLMYVIDRAVAAREMRRVLRPGGRFVAAVWAAAERCDIVLFQQTAGRFAPPPPVPGIGPGALADPTGFLAQLADAGIDVHVETEELGFDFHDFELAWEVLAGVTTAQLPPERRQEAKEAVQAVMWPHGRGSRHFRNVTQFLVGHVAG